MVGMYNVYDLTTLQKLIIFSFRIYNVLNIYGFLLQCLRYELLLFNNSFIVFQMYNVCPIYTSLYIA